MRALENLDLVSDGFLRKGAVLLFGKRPRQACSSARRQIGRFKGEVILDNRFLDGTLWEPLEATMDALRGYLQVREEIRSIAPTVEGLQRHGNGEVVRIGGQYMMFVSEGCGGKQFIGYSDDLMKWEFRQEDYLDASSLGRLYEVMSAVVNGDSLILDFFYDDGSGVTRSAEALYRLTEPRRQVALNRGGTLNGGGMIRYQDRWVHAQGWDAPPGKAVIHIYGSKKRTP